jgi:hypothetical protein
VHGGPGDRRGEIVEVDAGQVALPPPHREVLLELLHPRREERLHRQERIAAHVLTEHLEELGVPGHDAEERQRALLDALLDRQRDVAPERQGRLPHALLELREERPEDLLLVAEVVVEGAGREVGLAHDVARGRSAEPLLGEDLFRGSEELRPILRLPFLASPCLGDRVARNHTH